MTDETLQNYPTREEWEIELRRIIDGERAYAIAEDGSIQEYVRGILSRSRERPVAETFFEEALRNVVQSWQPSLVERTPRVARTLDLIAAFTPLPGFSKVMDLLDFWEYSVESPVSESVHARPQDLRMKALLTLSAYFPAAAPLYMKEEPAFRAYVYLLREHLLRPEPWYCGYAAQRLLEMQIIDTDGEEIRELIESNPRALREIIPLLLGRHTVQKDISSIYGQCLLLLARDEKPYEELLAALAERGAGIEVSGEWPLNWPELRLRGGRQMPLEMSERVLNIYVSQQRWGKDAASGEEDWHNMKADEAPGIEHLLSPAPVVSDLSM